MDSEWLWALIAIVAGMVLGSIAARLGRGLMGREKNPDVLQQNASALASMIFSVFLVIGLVTALGIIKPDALDQITDDAVSYLPRVLSAGIVVIIGNVLGTLAASATASAIGRAAGKAGEQIPMIIRFAILGFAAILASSQLGIDTTIINIAVAALLFSIGLSLAMLVGFGGQPVAHEIAAGRALRRILQPGDDIRSEGLAGTIQTVHSTAVEVEMDGESVLIPNSEIFNGRMAVTRRLEEEDQPLH